MNLWAEVSFLLFILLYLQKSNESNIIFLNMHIIQLNTCYVFYQYL